MSAVLGNQNRWLRFLFLSTIKVLPATVTGGDPRGQEGNCAVRAVGLLGGTRVATRRAKLGESACNSLRVPIRFRPIRDVEPRRPYRPFAIY